MASPQASGDDVTQSVTAAADSIGVGGFGVRHRGGKKGDDGLSMMEIIVGIVVLGVFAAISLSFIVRTTTAAAGNERRVAATNIANREIESAQALAPAKIPDGSVKHTVTSGNTDFTIEQTANYVAQDARTSACVSTSDEIRYKLITVSVTWPQMGHIPPVTVSSLKGLGESSPINSSHGGLGVLITDGAENPTPGVHVTVHGKKVVTGGDGCALFTGLMPGTYDVVAESSSHVAGDNSRTKTIPQVSVRAGKITRERISFHVARSVMLSVNTSDGYVLPQEPLPLMGRGAMAPRSVVHECTVAQDSMCFSGNNPRNVTNLHTGIYEFWWGTCSDASRPTIVHVALNPQTSIVGAGRARVSVRSADGQPVPQAAVSATHSSETLDAQTTFGCLTGENYTLSPTGPTGESKVSLPYGTWVFKLSDGTSSAPVTIDNTTPVHVEIVAAQAGGV